MELSEMQRLKQLADENRRLKQIVAETNAGHPGVESGGGKGVGGPIAKRGGGVASRGAPG
jgi:hypothetical protein